jgi:sensor histidine kinase YesM
MKANTYLAKFSKLTRLILEHSEKDTISLAEEADALILYLELEKMRFKENFHYHIDFVDIVSKESIELPPMIIQPYIENAPSSMVFYIKIRKKSFLFCLR